jgi:lipid-A-disaccharide synthase
MKYYLISGEASGDLHGSNLIRSLKQIDPHAEIRGWGGDLMQAQGMILVKHYRDLAFMGFIEVLFNLKTILGNIKRCKKDIEAYKPDVLILIDYPGFNMRIARWAKQQNIPVHYYIAPQAWAWKENRVKAIGRDVSALYVILPFEEAFFGQRGCPVHFVGHPLRDALENKPTVDADGFRAKYALDQRPIIALLPGSRRQEISAMLPVMAQMADSFTNYQFVVAGAPSMEMSFYQQLIDESKIKIVTQDTYSILSVAHAAMVTSGTATLETALLKVPQVVCYKGHWLSYEIAKRIIKLSYISLVNLILDAPAVPELIQSDFNTQSLTDNLDHILSAEGRSQQLKAYDQLFEKLGPNGASQRVAALIYGASQQ